MADSTFQLYDGDMEGLQNKTEKSLKAAKKTDANLNELTNLARNIKRKQAQIFQHLATEAGTSMGSITQRGASSTLFSPGASAAQKSHYADQPYRSPQMSSAIDWSSRKMENKVYSSLDHEYNAPNRSSGKGPIEEAGSSLHGLASIVGGLTATMVAANAVLQGISERGSEGSKKIGGINLAVSRASKELGTDSDTLFNAIKFSPDQNASISLINQAVNEKVSKSRKSDPNLLYAGLNYIAGGGDPGTVSGMFGNRDPRLYRLGGGINGTTPYDPEMNLRAGESAFSTTNAQEGSAPAERFRQIAIDRMLTERPWLGALQTIPGAGELGLRTATDTGIHDMWSDSQNGQTVGTPGRFRDPTSSPVRQPNVHLGASERGLTEAAASLQQAANGLKYNLPSRPAPNR